MRFVFKDTETSGADPRFDQILQFAAIVTDADLNEIEAVDLRARRLPHVLPSPVALKVTNVDPFGLVAAPLSYFEMAREIHRKFKAWQPATFIGHNTLGFDEEIERSMFYLNLLDPYVTSTKGCARGDTLTMVRIACALRPGILNVRISEKGSPIYKLEILAADNGFTGHHAHDALGDIRACIHIAKLIKTRAPEIFAAVMGLTTPAEAEAVLDKGKVLLLTHFGKTEFLPAVRVVMNPSNKRQAVMVNLNQDLTAWAAMTPADMAAKMFTKESPFQTVKTNAMPSIFAADDVLGAAKFQEVAPAELEARIQFATSEAFKQLVVDALSVNKAGFAKSPHLEGQIYEGFPEWKDKKAMERFHEATDWTERRKIAAELKSDRLRGIANRLFWIEAPALLAPEMIDTMDRRMVEERFLSPLPPAPKEGEKAEKEHWTSFASARRDLAALDPALPLSARIGTWFQALEAAITVDPAAIRTFA
jgi:exodeoxyribonuclease-1